MNSRAAQSPLPIQKKMKLIIKLLSMSGGRVVWKNVGEKIQKFAHLTIQS